MKKLLNNPWVVAVLAIAAISFVALSLREQMGGPRGSGRVAALQVDDETALEDTDGEHAGTAGLSVSNLLATLVFPADLPDPFVRRGATMVSGDGGTDPGPVLPDHVETVRLTAVWNQGGTTFAVMNGRIVQSGEAIGRMTVDTIATDGVWVTHWKGRDFISFGAEFSLVTPATANVAAIRFPHEN